jgi:kinetochore protein Mis12/MTW1
MMEIDASQAAMALLTEHLQYTPLVSCLRPPECWCWHGQSLIDDIINSVNNFIYQGVGSLETGLISTPPERLGFKPKDGADGESDLSDAKQEIEEGLHQFETLLNATVDKNFDKFEIYLLRNILSVPADLASWVRLNHYQGIAYPPPQHVPTAESVQLLRRKLAASRALSRSLMQEQARNEAILQQLRALHNRDADGNMAFLTQSAGSTTLNVSANGQAFTTNTTFVMSQLPALKALLAELRPRLAALKNADIGINSAKDENRQERREYIEQRTKTHIERNGGAMADNAAALPGKPLDTEEMQALEKVAKIFKPDWSTASNPAVRNILHWCHQPYRKSITALSFGLFHLLSEEALHNRWTTSPSHPA